MSKQNTPFRYDFVGSFLRPAVEKVRCRKCGTLFIIHNVKGPVNRNISPQAACFPGKRKKDLYII